MKLLTFFLIFFVGFSFALAMKPAGSIEPKEPAVSRYGMPAEPDEPQPHDETDMDRFKFEEPLDPPTPEPRDGHFDIYEKEPEMLLFEPSPRGVIIDCPKGLICE